MLPAELAGEQVALARFRREVRHLARCEHPHIVKILSSGTLPDGELYYTVEYVPGCDLEMVWRLGRGVATCGLPGAEGFLDDDMIPSNNAAAEAKSCSGSGDCMSVIPRHICSCTPP
jgi:serine/threonine protein kinase